MIIGTSQAAIIRGSLRGGLLRDISRANAIRAQTVETEFRQSAFKVLNQDAVGAIEIASLEAFAQPRSGERGEGLRSYLGILFIELESLARRTQHLQQKFVLAAEHRFEFLAQRFCQRGTEAAG